MFSPTNPSAGVPRVGTPLDPFLVIHPLDDRAEEKVRSDHLPPLKMTPSVRISLFTLRAYLILMMGLLLWHVIELALGHSPAR